MNETREQNMNQHQKRRLASLIINLYDDDNGVNANVHEKLVDIIENDLPEMKDFLRYIDATDDCFYLNGAAIITVDDYYPECSSQFDDVR